MPAAARPPTAHRSRPSPLSPPGLTVDDAVRQRWRVVRRSAPRARASSSQRRQAGPPAEEEQAAARSHAVQSAPSHRALAPRALGSSTMESPSASGEDLRKLADAEWLALGPDRRLHFVRKIRQRSAAAVQGGGGAAASRVLKRGEPVPPRLVGRAKGMQALLAERGLESGLRGACENQEAHGAPKLLRVRRPSEAWAEEVGQPG